MLALEKTKSIFVLLLLFALSRVYLLVFCNIKFVLFRLSYSLLPCVSVFSQFHVTWKTLKSPGIIVYLLLFIF